MPDTRAPVRLDMTTQELVMEMSEGNPGAINVMMLLLREEKDIGIFKIFILDDMNIRGTQIWIAYKDACNQDLKVLDECLRDPKKRLDMIETINKVGKMGNHPWKAIESGASELKDRPKLDK